MRNPACVNASLRASDVGESFAFGGYLTSTDNGQQLGRTRITYYRYAMYASKSCQLNYFAATKLLYATQIFPPVGCRLCSLHAEDLSAQGYSLSKGVQPNRPVPFAHF